MSVLVQGVILLVLKEIVKANGSVTLQHSSVGDAVCPCACGVCG